MEIKTADLCDNFCDRIKVASPIGFKDYGGKKAFCGKIVTVKCYESNPLIRKELESDGTGKVLVIDGGGSKRCALIGDNMTTLAIQNNWNGIVLFGSIRDSAAISRLPFGFKALDVNPLKSQKKVEGETNTRISFAGVDFMPGEFIYCDEDGIVVSCDWLAG